MKEKDKLCVVDKQDNKLDFNENWEWRVRTTGTYDKDDKKLEILIKIKTSAIFFD